MPFKAIISVSHDISDTEKTVVAFGKNEFSVIPIINKTSSYYHRPPAFLGGHYNERTHQNVRKQFYIKNIKGVFEILSMFVEPGKNGYIDVFYNKEDGHFETSMFNGDATFTFSIYTDVKFKKVEDCEKKVKISYDFWVSVERLEILKLHEYFEENIILPKYEHIKLKCYIKRVSASQIEILIQNPFGIEIGHKCNEFSCERVSNYDNTKNFKHVQEEQEKLHDRIFSTTKDVASSPKQYSANPITLYEILSDTTFADTACYFYCSEQVDVTNVCEVVEIAYFNNLEHLKQKCKQIMVVKKSGIDQEKLKALPKDILFDVYF